jgi:predicted nucleic acid-binding protein
VQRGWAERANARPGLEIAARYRLPVFDAMIVAAALEAGRTVLLSEDFQHGQRFAGRLRVANPFR